MIAPISIFVCRGILFFDFIFFARFSCVSRRPAIYICSKEDTYIAKTRLEIGEFFGKENAEVYVTLREPSTMQFIALQDVWKEQNEEKIIKSFFEMLPDLIVDSSIYETEDKKMDNKKLASLLFDRFDCITEIMRLYYQFLGDTQSKKKPKKEASKQ